MAAKYFKEQWEYGKYLLPYIKKHCGTSVRRILEVGCAEAGLISFLAKYGYNVHGLEIEKNKANWRIHPDVPVFIGDILKIDNLGIYDLIIMREVIEHIEPSQRITAIGNAVRMLNPGGYLFLSFPPKYSAFGGHQRIRIPWSHVFKNSKQWPTIAEIEGCCADLNIVDCNLFLFRPVFKSRYGLPTIKWPNIKLIRELAMGYECLYKVY